MGVRRLKNSKITLSLCIPTYNRSNYLKRMLSSIINQIGVIEHNHTIEICVSDNASPDDTLKVVNTYAQRHAITYRRNSANIGAGRNFFEVARMAKGEYIWILGDDDILTDGALDHLMKIIVNKRPDVIHVKALDGDRKPNLFKWMGDDIRMAKNEYYNFIVRDNLNHLGFTASTVFMRDKVDFNYAGEIVGRTNWPHLYTILEQYARIEDAFLTKPLVIQLADGDGVVRAMPVYWLIMQFEKAILLDRLSRIDSIQIPKANLLLIRQLFGKAQIKELLYCKMVGSIDKLRCLIKKYTRDAMKYKFLLRLYLFIVSIVDTKIIDILLSVFLFKYNKKIRKRIFREPTENDNEAERFEWSQDIDR